MKQLFTFLMLNVLACLGMLAFTTTISNRHSYTPVLTGVIDISIRLTQYPCPQTVLEDLRAIDQNRQLNPDFLRQLEQNQLEMKDLKPHLNREIARLVKLQQGHEAKLKSLHFLFLVCGFSIGFFNLIGFGTAWLRIRAKTREKNKLQQALENSQSELLNAKDMVKQRTRDMLTLKRDHKTLSDQFNQMLREAELDPKGTGALTAKAGMNLLCKALRHHLGYQAVWVLLIDADRFKSVNDTFGHKAGDTVLVNLVRCIQSELRSEDFLFRYGGEEFVAVLTGGTSMEAFGIAERLRKKMEKLPIWVGTTSISVTFSAGLAGCQDSELYEFTRMALNEQITGEIDENSLVNLMHELAENTIAQADALLYQAKRDGRNQICLRLPRKSGQLVAIG